MKETEYVFTQQKVYSGHKKLTQKIRDKNNDRKDIKKYYKYNE